MIRCGAVARECYKRIAPRTEKKKKKSKICGHYGGLGTETEVRGRRGAARRGTRRAYLGRVIVLTAPAPAHERARAETAF
jgi:hypothetical protein